MQTSREFLDAVKRRHSLTSDYQLAKFLQVSRQRISANLHGGVIINDEAALKVAEALELDSGYVLACLAAERSKTATARAAWLKLAGAAAAVLAAIAITAEPGALLPTASAAGLPSNAYYVKSFALLILLIAISAMRYISPPQP
jgi:hypothetical protein